MIPDNIIIGINILVAIVAGILIYKKRITNVLGKKIWVTTFIGLSVLNGVFLEPFREKADYGEWPDPTAYIIYAVVLFLSFFALKLSYKAIEKNDKRNTRKN